MDPRFSLAGLVVGIVVGLTGVGGSAILAPVLVLLLGVAPSVAIGTDLLYGVPTKLLAFFLHARRGTVDGGLVKRLLIGGLPGTLVGLACFAVLRAHTDPAALQLVMRRAIGVAILFAAAGAVVTWVLRRRTVAPEAVAPRPGRIVAIGALVGFLVAVTSIGSGSVTLPLLVLAAPAVALRRAIGSEIAFAALLIPVAAAGHLGLGSADPRIAAALVLGSLPGVWIGSRLTGVVGERWLRPIVVGTLAVAGTRLL